MKQNSKLIRIGVILLILTLVLFIYCFKENNSIEVENIKIKLNNLPKEFNGIKIAHISDVHLPKNASTIDNIINTVKHQKPDIIVLTGDIIDRDSNIDTCGLSTFCKGLSDITTTYAVTGNHEYGNGHVDKWKSILSDNNIKVIDNKAEIYSKSKKSIIIAGLVDGAAYKPKNLRNIKKIEGRPMLLLAHRPELFDFYSKEINPDIIFCGHAHGGQIRIPIINQGIIAPKQGFFPKYTSGVYTTNNDVKMIVSRGLKNAIIPIRLNNRPHLPIIELVGTAYFR